MQCDAVNQEKGASGAKSSHQVSIKMLQNFKQVLSKLAKVNANAFPSITVMRK